MKHNHKRTKRIPLLPTRSKYRRTVRHRGRQVGGEGNNAVAVYYGAQRVCQQKLTPDQVRLAPRIAFQTTPGKLYTILLYDSNVATPDYLHWLVPNVRDPSTLIPTVPYIPPSPSAESGYHTYMFEIYEQPEGVLQNSSALRGGPGFDRNAFLRKHGLRLVGSCGFFVSALEKIETP